MHPRPYGRPFRPVVYALAAAFLIVFCASAARHVIPGVKDDTRSATLHLRSMAGASAEWTNVRALRRVVQAPPQRRAAPAVYVAPRPTFALVLALPAPVVPLGDIALGTSLPKAAKWRVMGGHGRNGAG